jgi:hypothetical protein
MAEFGPQNAHVASLIGRAHQLTVDEASMLYAARERCWEEDWWPAWDVSAQAAMKAAESAADVALVEYWAGAQLRAHDAAWTAARPAGFQPQYSAAAAARDATSGLVLRDLITPDGHFTQLHYDVLTAPWRSTIGPIHPDDKPLGPLAPDTDAGPRVLLLCAGWVVLFILVMVYLVRRFA